MVFENVNLENKLEKIKYKCVIEEESENDNNDSENEHEKNSSEE